MRPSSLPHAVTRALNRLALTTWRATVELVEDRGHRTAAQIAFFAMLGAIPAALLLAAAFGLILGPGEVRARVIDTVFDFVPLAQEGQRGSLERLVADSLDAAGNLGLISLVVLVAAVTSAMSALRYAINAAWDFEASRSLLKRKALDLSLVLGVTLLLLVSLSDSAVRRGAQLADDEAAVGPFVAALLNGLGDVLPYLFTGAGILFLYRILPQERPKVREIWPGAVVATLLLAVVKGGLELYFERLADYGALYGSLGALMALLGFLFAASLVLVFGAEFASEWSRLPDDDEEVERLVARGRARILALGRRALRRERARDCEDLGSDQSPEATRPRPGG